MEPEPIGVVKKVRVACKTCHFVRNGVEIHAGRNISKFVGEKGFEVVNHFMNNTKHLMLLEGVIYAVENNYFVRAD